MRLYLEVIEVVTEEELEEGEGGDFVRIDITNWAKEDIAKAIKLLKEMFAGKNYQIRLHECRHDEGKPCSVKTIE